MKQIVFVFVFLASTSCIHSNNKGEILNAAKMKTEKAKNKFTIPEEIRENIDSSIVFAIAEIGTWEGDYIGNSLLVLTKDKKVKRIKNNKLPEKGYLFCSGLSDFYTTGNLEYANFINYLNNIADIGLKEEYTTPENLSVSGGAIHYVYICVNESKYWIRFEPESSSILLEIKEEFSKLFKN